MEHIKNQVKTINLNFQTSSRRTSGLLKIENSSVELQQSALYKKYIEQWGWTVISLDGVSICIRHIPFLGVMAKIQRPIALPYMPTLIPFLKKYRVQRVSVEPSAETDQLAYRNEIRTLSKFFTIHREYFLPTKTIRIDLTPPTEMIFNRFTEAKRRAVRRAQKNGVAVWQSTDIQDLISIKSKSAGLFGGMTVYGIEKLWKEFAPKNAAILLTYQQCDNVHSRNWGIVHSGNEQVVAGVLLLFWEKTAHYWIAGATRGGKKLFAPTLLVWEALKLSKKHGCSQFDFVGVFDERLPNVNTSWKGFTKFKEGFGGEELYYPIISTPRPSTSSGLRVATATLHR